MPYASRPHYALYTIGFGAGISYVIALAIEAYDEHRAPVTIADRLIGCKGGPFAALRRAVANALAEASVTEFVGAAKEFDGIVGIVWG